MPRLLITIGLIGGFAGFLLLGPEFSNDHSLAEQVALGLLAILMICTLFGMKITSILGFLVRTIIIAVIWRAISSILRLR